MQPERRRRRRPPLEAFNYTQEEGWFYVPLLTADGDGVEAYVPFAPRRGIFTLGPLHNPFARDFAARVRGEHMRPRFEDGAIVYARRSWAAWRDPVMTPAFSWGKVYRDRDGLVNVRRWALVEGVDLLVADADESIVFADEVELLGGTNGRYRPEHKAPMLPV